MTYPIERRCLDCERPFMATGPRSERCPECRLKYKRKIRNAWHMMDRTRKGDPTVGVGRGGSNKKYKEHGQYKTGIAHFIHIRKELLSNHPVCERCGKDLSNATRYEKCVHHIDHDRTHNDRDNLMVLCKRCHQLEHECWKAFEGATTISKESRGQASSKQAAPRTGEDIV